VIRNAVYLVDSAKDATQLLADGLRASGAYIGAARLSPLERPSVEALSTLATVHGAGGRALVVRVTSDTRAGWRAAAEVMHREHGVLVVNVEVTELYTGAP